MNLKYITIIFYFISSVLIFPYSSRSLVTKESSQSKIFSVWALADLQPRNERDKDAFIDAINDVNININNVDIAVVAGDIVNRTESDVYDWYLNSKNISYIDKWYEIIGNHDLKTDKGILFKEKLRDEIHYIVEYGNILFIFLSDEKRGKATVIKDETFEWWKNIVINNQDKIIVVVTHAPLEGSTILFSNFDERQITDSGRFRQVIKNYQVDIWLSAHLHIPQEMTNTITKNEELNGTVFIHISSIRPELLGIKHSESRVLEFYCNSKKILIKARNHKKRKWINGLETEFELSKNIECE